MRPTHGRHPGGGMDLVPTTDTISAHKTMYRRRAKLRDILHVVDRHNMGAMPREKFHMCLELADLPIPDRQSEETMYGRFLNRENFRYVEFLDALKYDESYRHLLTSRWKDALPMAKSRAAQMHAPQSMTPEPGVSGITLPHIGKPPTRASVMSRTLSRHSDKGETKRLVGALRMLDQGQTGQLSIEQLQKCLVTQNMVPNASNDELLNLFRSCDEAGNGMIDYNKLSTKLQARETQGNPIFVTGYRAPSAMRAASQASKR